MYIQESRTAPESKKATAEGILNAWKAELPSPDRVIEDYQDLSDRDQRMCLMGLLKALDPDSPDLSLDDGYRHSGGL